MNVGKFELHKSFDHYYMCILCFYTVLCERFNILKKYGAISMQNLCKLIAMQG